MVSEQLDVEILTAVHDLSFDKQRQVLDFAQFLRREQLKASEPAAHYGSLKHLRMDVTLEDMAELRRDLTSKFTHDTD